MSFDEGFKDTKIGRIPADWNIVKIGDISEVQSGYGFKSSSFVDNGFALIKIKNIIPPYISLSNIQYISDELALEKKEFIIKYNDILISLTGSNVNQFSSAVGKVGRVKIKNKKLILNQRVGRFIVNNKMFSDDFLYYLISTDEARYQLASMAGGSANQANISPKQIKQAIIPHPPLPEQKAIAKILTSLDDKIELNNQMNKTLENIAQAIFKHWFIDFEFPNENGEPYKSSGGQMVESELGMIPKGWRVGKLSDVANIIMGQSPPSLTYNENNDGLPFYQGNRDFGYRFPSYRIYCNIPKRIALKNDILISVRAPIGDLNISIEKCCIGRGLSAIRTQQYHYGFLFYFLKTKNEEWQSYEQKGTVFGSLNKKELNGIKLIISKNNITEKFNTITKAIDKKIKNNEYQTIFLSKIRDTLLPKLMSGEVRVKVNE